VSDPPRAVADFVVDVAGRKDGLGATPQVRFVEATVDPALAVVQLSVYPGVHSKTLAVGVNGETVYSSDTPENTRVFEFSSDSCLPAGEGFAYSRARGCIRLIRSGPPIHSSVERLMARMVPSCCES